MWCASSPTATARAMISSRKSSALDSTPRAERERRSSTRLARECLTDGKEAAYFAPGNQSGTHDRGRDARPGARVGDEHDLFFIRLDCAVPMDAVWRSAGRPELGRLDSDPVRHAHCSRLVTDHDHAAG